MTVIPHGRFLKIVESPGVVTDNTQIFGPAAPVPDEDRYITRLYRLAHIDATETANILGKFKTKDGDITVYPPGNLLIITETGTNIQRMMRILEEIDVGGAGEQLWVEPDPLHERGGPRDQAHRHPRSQEQGSSGGAAGGGSNKGASGGTVGGGAGGMRIVSDDRGQLADHRRDRARLPPPPRADFQAPRRQAVRARARSTSARSSTPSARTSRRP